MSNAVGQARQTFVTEEEKLETKWILKYLKRRVCTTYIESNQSEESKTCQCGYTRQEHEQTISENSDKKWNSDKHTKCVPTNAFGEISFVGHGENKSKYVRVEKDTNMKHMMVLMTKFWKLEKPKLLISVTGGAKSFNMSKRLAETFQRGLIKAARSTGAWIVTGGSNAGVMKHVGEAIQKHGSSSAKADPVIAVGIAVWGCIQDNHKFIRNDKCKGRWEARYQIDKIANRNETFLNPNHSHFILVDDGSCHKFGGEIKFRASLQSEIIHHKESTFRREMGSDVPVVTIVLEGGEYTLGTIKESIQYDIPVVIIEGSGRIANIVAYAYQNAKSTSCQNEDGSTRKKLNIPKAVKKDIKKQLESEGIGNIKERTSDVVYIIEEKPDLLTVFRLSTFANTTQDIDVAILQSLLKGNKDKVFNQLKLALTWNRIDIAKTMNDNILETEELEDLLQRAIEQNKVDFVEMFIDQGVSMQDFLTKTRLLDIYEHSATSQIKSLLQHIKVNRQNKKQKSSLTLEQIGLLLQHLIGKFYISEYSLTNYKQMYSSQNEKKKTFNNPYQHLFIWSILMNKIDMAKFFWKQGKEKIPAALVGSAVMNALAKISSDSKQYKEMRENSILFSSLAIDSINACDEADERMTSDLLVRQNDQWGFATCLKLAVESNNKHFIAHSVCNSLLQHVWYGELATVNSPAKILFCMVCFVCIPMMNFRNEEETENIDVIEHQSSEVQNQQITENGGIIKDKVDKTDKQPSNETKRRNIQRFFMKCVLFYRAPVVKFFLNVVSYIIFLSFFSYILLVQFDNKVTSNEIILWIWVASIFADEFLQHFQTTRMETPQLRKVNYTTTLPSRKEMIKYASNIWILTDGLAILLLLIGIILRSTSLTFEASRVFFGLTLIVFFFRSLNIFSVHRRLGPTIVMIGRMFVDMLYFLIILMVFVISYSIAAYSILYPNSILNGSLLMKVMRVAYWNLYGELFVDELERQEPECTFDPNLYNNGTLPRCPTVVGSYVVPVLMGIYVMFSNILLLNLLIALFSNTVSRIQANTDLHWHFQRYFLISRYESRPPVPQPFVLIYYIYGLIRWIFGKCIQCCEKPHHSMLYKQVANASELVQWEKKIVNANLLEKKAGEVENIENRIKTIHESLEMVSLKVDEVHDMSTKRLGALENQIMRTSKTLSMIEKYLKENSSREQPPQAQTSSK